MTQHAGRYRRDRGPFVRLLAFVGVLALAAAACGGGDDAAIERTDPDLRPSTNDRRLILDDLPNYPNSSTISGPTTVKGAATQTFEVEGARPAAVVDFYVERLPDWDLVSRERLSDGVARARFVQDDTVLTVSTAKAPTLPDDNGAAADRVVAIQYSLTLEPADD